MSRWEEMARAFALVLDEAARHHDPAARAAKLIEARQLLQQFTASGNRAIEGTRKPMHDSPRRSIRYPYAD